MVRAVTEDRATLESDLSAIRVAGLALCAFVICHHLPALGTTKAINSVLFEVVGLDYFVKVIRARLRPTIPCESSCRTYHGL